MGKIVSIFESVRPEMPGFSSDEIEQHTEEFLRRGGKIQVIKQGSQSPAGMDPNGYAARRQRAVLKLKGSHDYDGNPPPEAA